MAILTTQIEIQVKKAIPDYDPSEIQRIKSAADRGDLLSVLSLGDVFGIPVTCKEGTYPSQTLTTQTMPFRVVHLTPTEAIFDMAAVYKPWEGNGIYIAGQNGNKLADEVEAVATKLRPTYTNIMSDWEYYTDATTRKKPEYRLASGESAGGRMVRSTDASGIGTFGNWVVNPSGAPSAPSGTSTRYFNSDGEYSNSGYSIKMVEDIAFRISQS